MARITYRIRIEGSEDALEAIADVLERHGNVTPALEGLLSGLIEAGGVAIDGHEYEINCEDVSDEDEVEE